MSITIFTNIGARDVYYKCEGAGEFKTFKDYGWSPRENGKTLLETFDDDEGSFSAPIVEKAIEYLKENLFDNENIAIRWIFFYTDQDEYVAEESDRKKDTLYFARIIHKIKHVTGYEFNLTDEEEELEDNGYIACKCGSEKEKIDLVKIEPPPQLYDSCFDFYKEKLMRLFADEMNNESFKPYVLAAGGTPACNTGLLLAAISLFEDRVRQIYVPRNEDAHEIGFGERVLHDYRLARIRSHLANYQFAAAAAVIRELVMTSGGGEDKLTEALLLAESADRRINLDFVPAKAIVANIEAVNNEENLEILAKEDQEWDEEKQKTMVGEMYWHVKMALELRDYRLLAEKWHKFSSNFIRYACESLHESFIGIGEKSFKEKKMKEAIRNYENREDFNQTRFFIDNYADELGGDLKPNYKREVILQKCYRPRVYESESKCYFIREARNHFVHRNETITLAVLTIDAPPAIQNNNEQARYYWLNNVITDNANNILDNLDITILPENPFAVYRREILDRLGLPAT